MLREFGVVASLESSDLKWARIGGATMLWCGEMDSGVVRTKE